jgi:hypothetical protein
LSRNPFSRQTSRRCYICALIHWHASWRRSTYPQWLLPRCTCGEWYESK